MATKITEQYKKWQKAEQNGVQEKSGGGFSLCLELATKALAPGRYRISWNAETRRKSGTPATVYPKIRVKVDGAVRAISTFNPPLEEWQAGSGWDFEAFNADDTPVIILEAQRWNGSGAQPVELRRLKLSIELMEK